MFEILKDGGLLMVPIIACSIFALAIIIERFINLRESKILPESDAKELYLMVQRRDINERRVSEIAEISPLGSIMMTGLMHSNKPRHILKEHMEETERFVTHSMERYLNALGTIAAITPLLGLLGTVIGMIEVFAVITANGAGNSKLLAGGISKALITTATGISVAVPSLFFHRYFRARVDALSVSLEQEASRFADELTIVPTKKASE